MAFVSETFLPPPRSECPASLRRGRGNHNPVAFCVTGTAEGSRDSLPGWYHMAQQVVTCIHVVSREFWPYPVVKEKGAQEIIHLPSAKGLVPWCPPLAKQTITPWRS